MELYLIFYLLFVHWVADFVFQDEEWALNKSTSWNALMEHTSVYAGVLCIAFIPILWTSAIYFAAVNFIWHTTIDFITSKIVKKRFENKYLGGSIPNLGAFTIIGFDQVLHYIILFATLQYFL